PRPLAIESRRMRLSDFDFELPAELIAQHPPAERGASRLLVVRAARPAGDAADEGRLEDRAFADLPSLLAPGDLPVLNDSRVIRARLFGVKDTGGRIEALVERVTGPREAIAMLRASKPPKPGSRIAWRSGGAEVLARADEFWRLRFDDPVMEVLEREGRLP